MGVPDMTLPLHVQGEGEERELRESILYLVGQITKKYDRVYWRKCEIDRRLPDELSVALGEAGLLGLGVPTELGGMGGGLLDQVVLVEALGRAGIPAFPFAVGNFARSLVMKHGSADQIARFLPPTLDGKGRTSFALTEANAGTNSFAMRTRADQVDGGWKISGEKVFISAAAESTQMLLVARTSPFSEENKSHGLSLLIVDPKAPGISMSPLNIQATPPETQYIVHFDDVFVPADNLVGEAGRGISYLFKALNPERILCATMAMSLGLFAVDKGISYASVRAPFGTPIGTYQAVQHPLARAYIQLEAARLMTYEAASAYDRGENPGQSSNAAKWLASEAAHAALDATIQSHGGYAFDRDYDVITLYEPLRQLRITPINNDIVLSYTAEHTLGMPRAH